MQKEGYTPFMRRKMTIREISKDVRKNESVALPGVYTCEMKNDKRRLKTGKNNNAHPQYWTEHINRPSYRQQKESGFENRKKKVHRSARAGSVAHVSEFNCIIHAERL